MNAQYLVPKKLLVAAAVLAVMALATSQAQAQTEGKSGDLHYLAVGVSKVPHLPPASQLRFAHKDALDLATVWKKQQGAVYKKVRGETLIDSKAKLGDILAALDRLNSAAKKGDTVVISISGHGGLTGKNANWFFCTNNFTQGKAGKPDQNGLHDAVLRAKLARMTKRGVMVILMLDTCHAGAFTSSDNILVFAACGAKENSNEDNTLKNGLFTRALLEAFEGKADVNGDGKVTLAEVKSYVARRVSKYQEMHPSTDKDGRKVVQRPSIKGPPSIRGDHVIAGRPPVAGAAAGRDATMPLQLVADKGRLGDLLTQ